MAAINNLLNNPEPEVGLHKDHLGDGDGHHDHKRHGKSAQNHKEDPKEEKHESKHRKKKHKRKWKHIFYTIFYQKSYRINKLRIKKDKSDPAQHLQFLFTPVQSDWHHINVTI